MPKFDWVFLVVSVAVKGALCSNKLGGGSVLQGGIPVRLFLNRNFLIFNVEVNGCWLILGLHFLTNDTNKQHLYSTLPYCSGVLSHLFQNVEILSLQKQVLGGLVLD